MPPAKRLRLLSADSLITHYIVMAHRRCTKGPLFYTCLTLNEGGELYGHGDNTMGILGLGHDRYVAQPRPIPISNVIKVCHTKTSVIVLTSEKHVYSWGDNYSGQLGHGQMRGECFRPMKINFQRIADPVGEEHMIKDISCGAWHGMALTTEGRVFTWGGNWVGQLANRRTSDCRTDGLQPTVSPFCVTLPKPVVAIESGVYHCVVIDCRGVAWGWGSNLYGQLPVANFGASETITQPMMLYPSDIEPIRGAACGSFNTLLLTETGHVYFYGDPNHTSPNFSRVPLKFRHPVLEVHANYGLVFAKDAEHKFYVWGELRGQKKMVRYPQRAWKQVKSVDHVLRLFSRHECTQMMVEVEDNNNNKEEETEDKMKPPETTTQVLDFDLRHRIFTTLMPKGSNKWL